MLKLRGAGARNLIGMAVVLALMTGVGSGLSAAGAALAGVSGRRADMLAAGVDRMPVGTARQVERAKQARPAKP